MNGTTKIAAAAVAALALASCTAPGDGQQTAQRESGRNRPQFSGEARRGPRDGSGSGARAPRPENSGSGQRLPPPNGTGVYAPSGADTATRAS